jgi:hypothetical protein
MPFWRFGVASERSTSEPLARFRAEHPDDWGRAKNNQSLIAKLLVARFGRALEASRSGPACPGHPRRAGSMKIPKWLRRRNGLRTPAGAIIP